MPDFVKIADGPDVGPAPGRAGAPAAILGAAQPRRGALCAAARRRRRRLLERELPAVWRLIDAVLALAASRHGDSGKLSHARVGPMPPGCGLPPHCDGIDGIRDRRYQLALLPAPGVEPIFGGEAKRPLPGEAWQIDAGRIHSVANNSPADRITILFDTRRRSPPASYAGQAPRRGSEAGQPSLSRDLSCGASAKQGR